MKRSRRALTQGTTLVELIVTIVFLSVCIVPMLSMVNATQVRANNTRARMVGLALAQDELEKQRTAARKTPPLVGTLNSVLSGVTGLLNSAKLKVVVKSGGVPKLYDVSVEVEYNDAGDKILLSTKVKSNG